MSRALWLPGLLWEVPLVEGKGQNPEADTGLSWEGARDRAPGSAGYHQHPNFCTRDTPALWVPTC